MGRLRAASLLLAALAAGLLLAACGSSSNDELLPGTTAKQIESNLDQVRSNAEEGNCEAAEDAVAEVSTEIDGLQKVDKELKKALKQGAAKLSEVVGSCGVKEEEAEQAKADEEAEKEQANLEAEEEVAAEEEAAEKLQKTEEREDKAEEKAEKHVEQPGPSEEGEESGPKGKAKGHEEEEIEPEGEEEVIPPTEGGPAGGIGPGAEVERKP
jgi:chromosome segregation ATPase